MYAVLGITGNTGGAAAAALLRAGEGVRALVRRPERAATWERQGVKLVGGDASDPEALATLFTGVAGAYVLAPPNVAHPDPRADYEAVARAVAQAARASGLPKLVFLSSEGAQLDAGTGPILGVHRAEAVLSGAAPRTTFLRATYFQENWAAVFPVAAAQGVLPTFLTDFTRPRTMVATRDIGETAAALLRDPAAPEIVELEGPTPYTVQDVAATMGEVLGRAITPVVPPRETWIDTLVGAGVGRSYAALLAEMYDGINSGHVRWSGAGELRRGTTPISETITSFAHRAAA